MGLEDTAVVLIKLYIKPAEKTLNEKLNFKYSINLYDNNLFRNNYLFIKGRPFNHINTISLNKKIIEKTSIVKYNCRIKNDFTKHIRKELVEPVHRCLLKQPKINRHAAVNKQDKNLFCDLFHRYTLSDSKKVKDKYKAISRRFHGLF